MTTIKPSRQVLKQFDTAIDEFRRAIDADDAALAETAERSLRAALKSAADWGWNWEAHDRGSYARGFQSLPGDELAREGHELFKKFSDKIRRRKFEASTTWDSTVITLAVTHFDSLLGDGTPEATALFSQIFGCEKGESVERAHIKGKELFVRVS